MKSNIDQIIESMPKDSSWSYTLVNSASNRSTLLAQMPGEGNRRHYHDNWDEWWLIIKGEWEFEYDNKLLNASKGDLIYLKRNTIHKIKAIGEHLSVRMAVSRDDVEHIYLEKDYNNE
jgi:quercetin dioxygenase-like cupin family protein